MASGRRELTWQACDALAAAGRKPSISSVREWTLAQHGRKQGSDTDTQADINAWYALLLAMKQEQRTIAGLPDDVAELARGLWIRANDAANEGLAAHRMAIDGELADAQARSAAADAQAIDAGQRADAITHALDIARESIRRLEESLCALRATVQATDVRHAGQLQARDDRIAGLAHDIVQKDSEHAARATEFDGLRRHALLQIDEARTESRYWKNECERTALSHQAALQLERQATAKLQAELAGACGRLSAVEESFATARERSAALEAELVTLRQAGVATQAAAATRRVGLVRPPRTMPFRRRKL